MAKKSPKSRMMQTSMSKSPVHKSPMVKTSMSKSSMSKSHMPKSPMSNSPMPKSPVIYEKYKSRCAYGFFNLLRRRSKKLIADADRSRISKHAHGDGCIKNRLDLCSDPCIDDEVDKKILAVGSANVKVNNIKAEDVFIDQQKKKITTAKVDHAQSNSELVHDLSRHQRKETKTARKARRLPRYGCYDVSTMGNRNPTDQNLAGRSSKSLDAVTAEVLPNQVCPKNGGGSNCKNTSSVQYDQLNEINLQVNMREATEAFINQKLIDGKHLCGDGVSRQSQHFLDALDILNSNKDLFIKLLQDPNSLLVKHIEDLRDCQVKHEQSKHITTAITEDQIGDKTEGNLSKSKETSDCHPLENIVVLMPNRISHDSPQSHHSLRNVHQSVKPAFFPFEQMKRKLMQTLRIRRKDKQLVLSDGAVDHWSTTHDSASFEECGKRTGVENFTRNSPDKASSDFGGVTASSIAINRKDQTDKVSELVSVSREEAAPASESDHEKSCLSTLRHPERNKHDKNIEPRINISDLKNGNAILLKKQKAKTWDGMSLVPEYDFSPMVSPRETREHGSVSPQMRFSVYSSHLMGSDSNWRNQKEKTESCSSPLRQNLEAPPWAVNRKQQQMNEKISDNLFPDVEEHKSISSLNNNSSQIETKYIENAKEIRPSEVCSKLDGSHNDDVSQSAEAVDACEQHESLGFSRMDSPVENQPSTSSVDDYASSPLSSASVEKFDRIKDSAEQPSPISVLDQFYREDADCPSNIESQPALPSVRQLQIGSEEGCLAGLEFPLDLNINSSSSTEESRSMLKYVNAVLQACRLEWDELASKCHFSDQLLDRSLFDDIDVWPNESCGDRRLLFNYTNEVIVDVSQYYLRCSPWLSFIKPRIVSAMITGSLLHEVMKKVDWNLILKPPLQTLEKIIEKDLHSSGTWMDFRMDAEDVVHEMVDSLVEELTIEVALLSNQL